MLSYDTDDSIGEDSGNPTGLFLREREVRLDRLRAYGRPPQNGSMEHTVEAHVVDKSTNPLHEPGELFDRRPLADVATIGERAKTAQLDPLNRFVDLGVEREFAVGHARASWTRDRPVRQGERASSGAEPAGRAPHQHLA